jgi:hypothetical protein
LCLFQNSAVELKPGKLSVDEVIFCVSHFLRELRKCCRKIKTYLKLFYASRDFAGVLTTMFQQAYVPSLKEPSDEKTHKKNVLCMFTAGLKNGAGIL